MTKVREGEERNIRNPTEREQRGKILQVSALCRHLGQFPQPPSLFIPASRITFPSSAPGDHHSPHGSNWNNQLLPAFHF